MSISHLPVATNLPANVSLRYLDIFERYSGRFHSQIQRNPYACLRRSSQRGKCEPTSTKSSSNIEYIVLTAVLRLWLRVTLVEPGGYLQWDEFKISFYAAHSPAINNSKHSSDHIIKVCRDFTEKLGLNFKYVLYLNHIGSYEAK